MEMENVIPFGTFDIKTKHVKVFREKGVSEGETEKYVDEFLKYLDGSTDPEDQTMDFLIVKKGGNAITGRKGDDTHVTGTYLKNIHLKSLEIPNTTPLIGNVGEMNINVNFIIK